MGDYLIQPWSSDPACDSDMYLPPEIEELALLVSTHYDMKLLSKTLITTKPDKGGAIWKIETDQGPRSLKVLHRKPIRSLFSIGAQDYIVKQGGRVPELKKTREGALYVEQAGKLWIVTDWIEELTPAGKDLKGAQALCYGLGEFHRHSQGYIPPLGAQRASRLYRWPAYYRKITKKIDWFRNVALAYKHIPGSKSLLLIIDSFERQALDALAYLEQSSYTKLISKGEEHWGLVHQDYGWSNGQLGPGGLWVIDLDGVAYDLPIRDLRKLISSTMDDLGKWDADWIRAMFEAYHQANPLDKETYELFLNDLAFPNEFYKNVNEILFDPPCFINNDLELIIQHLTHLEKTKQLTLDELRSDLPKFQAGDYSSITIGRPEALVLRLIDSPKSPDRKTVKEVVLPDKKPLVLAVDPSLVEDFDRSHNKQNSRTKSKKPTPKNPAIVEAPIASKHKNQNLKVLMICTEKLPVPPVRGGAIQTYIEGIAGILARQHDLTILGTSDPLLPQLETRDNVRYVRIAGRQAFEVYAQEVRDFLKQNSFDLIHVFNRPRLIPLIRATAPHSRILLSMHNDMFNHDKLHPNEALTVLSEVEQIITVSNYVGNTICQLYPQARSKVRTIYSGVNLAAFTPWEQSNSATKIREELRQRYDLKSKTVVLFVGRLTPKKGTDLLIQALNEAYAFNPNIALVIVGGAWYSDDTVTDYVAYVRSLAERTPYPVITTGYVAAELIPQWFWAGDIFVCPSQWQEPLARVHYEAMAAGLPFITTARGGNPEVVIGQNGLIVKEPEDAVDFAAKLKTLLSQPKLRQIMGQNGRLLAEERFSWQRVADEVLEAWKPRLTKQKKTKEKTNKNKTAQINNDAVKDLKSLKEAHSAKEAPLAREAIATKKAPSAREAIAAKEALTAKAAPVAMEIRSSVIRITREMIRH